MQTVTTPALVALLLSLLATAACAGTLLDPSRFDTAAGDAGGPTTIPPTLDAAPVASCPDVASLLVKSCGGAGCHDAMTKAEGLDLASPGVASRLVGHHAVEGPGFLIDPTTPPSSVVYTKLLASPPFGVRMPIPTSFDDATIQCVLAWVTTEASSAPASPSAADGGAAPAADSGGVVDAKSEDAPTFSPVRVAAGQTTAVTDAQGNVWSADTDFTGGTAAVQSPPTAITGSDTPALYNGQRYGNPSFSYQFSVPNGTYAVKLKFAEQYVTGAGMRLFAVAINGTTVEPSLDIYAAAGAMNAAVDRSYTATATAGTIKIDFTQGSVQFPKVDAIQITQGAASGDGGP